MGKTGTFAVFARKESQDALARLGTVQVEEGGEVEKAAQEAFGEDWLEMIAIPEDGITWAIREE